MALFQGNGASGLFDSFKSKLGFGSREQVYDDYDERYDDYDDYVDGGDLPDYGYDEFVYGDGGNEKTGAIGHSATSTPHGSGLIDSAPRLVSLEDVRATTPVPDMAAYDSGEETSRTTSPRRSRAGSRVGRTMVDSSLPPEMTPEGTAAYSAAASSPIPSAPSRTREKGLDALFGHTDDNRPSSASTSGTAGEDSRGGLVSPGTSKNPQRRALFVLAPKAYGDASQMVDALDRDEVVILDLRELPDTLSKRILDFSFGVACALDASVDCIADDLFTFAHGEALNDAERMSLRARGVL